MELTDLIGVPYKENGRNIAEGFDCYGLAIEVEKRMGKTLKDVIYNDHNPNLVQKNENLINVIKRTETDSFNIGDIVEIIMHGELHIGVIISDKTFIHATYNQGVRISLMANYPIKNIYEVI